jgi:hypothetical protein
MNYQVEADKDFKRDPSWKEKLIHIMGGDIGGL